MFGAGTITETAADLDPTAAGKSPRHALKHQVHRQCDVSLDVMGLRLRNPLNHLRLRHSSTVPSNTTPCPRTGEGVDTAAGGLSRCRFLPDESTVRPTRSGAGTPPRDLQFTPSDPSSAQGEGCTATDSRERTMVSRIGTSRMYWLIPRSTRIVGRSISPVSLIWRSTQRAG